jgi:hypothetical protein
VEDGFHRVEAVLLAVELGHVIAAGRSGKTRLQVNVVTASVSCNCIVSTASTSG